jgi:hypothetical protein
MTKHSYRSQTVVCCAALLFTLAAHGQTRTQDAMLDASDPIRNQQFGSSVALDGDTAVVGAPREDRRSTGGPRDEGAAYVYRRGTIASPCPGGADWCEEAKLTPVFSTEANRRIRLGWDVAISGDTIVAGAPRYGDSPALHRIGKVFIYRRDPNLSVCGDLWCIERELLAADGMVADDFGESVAINGDTLFVGTRSGTIGSVYIFTRSGTTWTQQDKLTPPTSDPFQSFGNNLALDGDTLLIGAIGDSTPVMDDPTDYSRAGAAYVYAKAAGTWTFHSKLQASDRRAQDQFGAGMALSGDTAVIGAPRFFDGSCNGGAAYFFTLVGGIWQEQAKVLSPNGTEDDCYGFVAAMSGTTVIIAADLEDTPATNAGAAYIYTGSGASWTLANRMGPADAEDWDTFGWDAAIDGNTALLGAPAFGDPGFDRSGSAYVYELDRAETRTGDDVAVTPLPLDGNGDPVPNGPPMSLQFAQVTDAGNTTVVITDTAPPLPEGFRVGGLSGEPAYFDIHTEAVFVPPVEICINYSTLALEGDPADLALAHEEGGVWVDKTTSNDTVAMIICGEVNTFSLFAVLGIPSADSLLTELSDAVALLSAGNGTISSLVSKLFAAQAQLADDNANNDRAAMNLLQAFINAVEAQRGKKISDAEADLLLQSANEIRLVIEGVSL